MFLAEELCDTVAFLNEGRIAAQDTPWNLKQQYGERSVRVETEDKGVVASEVLFPGNPDDAARLKKLIGKKNLRTIHSQEATLEQIFVRLTGRGLA
jgi:fluoroquinolone transport system ATP-binding protein